jgi:hypothetical protein
MRGKFWAFGLALALSGAFAGGAGAVDSLRLLGQVSHANVQEQMKKVLDQRGARYTPAQLAVASQDCYVKLTARGRATSVSCGLAEAIQFQIQVGTSDLQNAENVR